MILPHDANPSRIKFSERTGLFFFLRLNLLLLQHGRLREQA
jgi:hypothetical protein